MSDLFWWAGECRAEVDALRFAQGGEGGIWKGVVGRAEVAVCAVRSAMPLGEDLTREQEISK